MSRSYKERNRDYVAEDAQGRKYQIIEYTEFHPDMGYYYPLKKEYRSGEGFHLDRLSETEFEIVESGVKLTLIS